MVLYLKKLEYLLKYLLNIIPQYAVNRINVGYDKRNRGVEYASRVL